MALRDWSNQNQYLVGLVDAQFNAALDTYRADLKLLHEHANQEDSFRTGGYAERQLFELVQNAADAISRSGSTGRIELRLTDDALYCANEGLPFDEAGVNAVTHAYLSDKRGEEIGRFGLGFKSVLSITDNAQIYSRPVSFEFNAPRAQEALKALAPYGPRWPHFRIPTPIDVAAALESDRDLRELAEWATTIIKMPNLRHRARLRTQLDAFETEFLLFANSVSSLQLTVRSGSEVEIDRAHRCKSLGDGEFELSRPSGEADRWIVTERMHQPGLAARLEVGEATARASFKISHAAPLDQGQQVRMGRFWAYFPLRDETTATGLFNAPWSVNDDRTTMLEGIYNREILNSFTTMFVETLPRFRTEADPARHFDYLPSRPREVLSPGDRILSTAIPALAASVPMIPDGDGVLQIGSALRPLSFDATFPQEAMEIWRRAPQTSNETPHSVCYSSPLRRARLRELFTNELLADGKDEKTARESVVVRGVATWLTELADNSDSKYARDALMMTEMIKDRDQAVLASEARIIPTTGGGYARLSDRGSVFLSGDLILENEGFKFVREDFLRLTGVPAFLEKRGFHAVEPIVELRAFLSSTDEGWPAENWQQLWDLVDEVPQKEAIEAIRHHVHGGRALHVMTDAGTWRDPADVMDTRTLGFEIPDPLKRLDFRTHTAAIASAAGVVARVIADYPVIEEASFRQYRAWAENSFRLNAAKKTIRLVSEGRFGQEYAPGPIGLLEELNKWGSEAGLVKWSAALLECEADRTWLMRANNQSLDEVFPAPHIWAVMEWGLIQTTWGARRPRESLHPSLLAYMGYLPVSIGMGSRRLDLTDSLDEVTIEIWQEFLTKDHQTKITGSPDMDILVDLVVRAVQSTHHLAPIGSIPAVVGHTVKMSPAVDVFLAENDDQEEFLRRGNRPYLRVGTQDSLAVLFAEAGCRLASDAIAFDLQVEVPSDPELMIDRFIGLRDYADRTIRKISLVRCMRLARRVTGPDGIQDQPVRATRVDDLLYATQTVEDEELLGIISREFRLALTPLHIRGILQASIAAEVQLLEENCRSSSDDAERIGLLVGPDGLEAKLPAGLLRSLEALGVPALPKDIPRIFLDVHGYDALRELSDQLSEKILGVPQTWSGSAAALRFVKRFGFSSRFAGERGSSLANTLTVLGKPGLEPLHEYQERILGRIRDLLRSEPGSANKAMVELPTGAGKTRVTVESVIRAFLDEDIAGPVLWIAQSEELCEQAVQTWNEVWREFSDSRPLIIGRLWGDNEVIEPDSELCVIVATDAKLDNLLEKVEYEWLAHATAVIVDEAHTAGDSEMYTRILRWLGVDGRSFERPLLGLSATPFKGKSEERTRRLAARFGHELFNSLGDDPYGTLQDMGVLSRVEHKVLPGAALELNKDELAETLKFQRLSSAVLERIATDGSRTSRLVEHIMSLPDDWPVLVFTSSVLSAQIVATLLRSRNVQAAAVSGKTRRQERRRIIDNFKAGELRVLVNCDVLTQGFDAPGIRALYIARPTLSPNAYIQMAGRGLRGPLNGGSEECLIVDLADSFSNLGRDLAHRDFEKLWERR